MTCELVDRPGDERHMMHKACPDCTAVALASKSLGAVESWWKQGIISRDALDGYRHVWALSATRSKSFDHWRELPSEEAQVFAVSILAVLARRGFVTEYYATRDVTSGNRKVCS